MSSVSEKQVTCSPLEGNDAGISIVSLNRPLVKNAIGRTFLRELREILDQVKDDPSVRVMIVNSSVSGVFCAGADLKVNSLF